MPPALNWLTPRVRQTLAQLALLAGAVALLWWSLRALGGDDTWRNVWSLLRDLSWWAVAALLVANALVLWTLMLRWWLFLRAQGAQISQWRLLSYRLTGFGVSYFTPGPQVGGEPLQVYLLSRRSTPHARVPVADATASLTLDKLLEFVTNFGFLLLGVIFLIQQQRSGRFGQGADIPGGAAAQLALYALLFLGLLWILWRFRRGRLVLAPLLGWLVERTSSQRLKKWRNAVERVERQTISVAHEQPRAVVLAVAVSLASWALMIGEFWLMTWVLGFDLAFGEAVLALIAMRAAYLLPVPAAVGSLEATLVWVLAAFGLSPAAGISLSLLIRTRDVLLGATGLLLAVGEVGNLRAVTNLPSAASSK